MSLHVDLEGFSGPLDLLLYLIRRDEIDIHDIPVAHIAREYLATLRTLAELDIAVGGEFLVVATMLLEIKSQMALARHQRRETGRQSGQAIDPRYELVRQLLEYRRFRDAADQLTTLEQAQAMRYAHPLLPADLTGELPPPTAAFLRADLWDLVAAYGRILGSIGIQHPMEIPYDDTPIEVYFDRLERAVVDQRVPFDSLMAANSRHELIGLFLALLELLKQRRLVATTVAPGVLLVERGPGLQAIEELDEASESRSSSSTMTWNGDPLLNSPW